jgi:phage terminase large subunit-like protein
MTTAWQTWCAEVPGRVIPGYDADATASPGEWFDPVAAGKAIQFLERMCVHIEGDLAGTPFILQPWQQAQFGALYGWKRADGLRRYREGLVKVPRKNGKALALDTPVPTPNGWTTMGELKAGDRVFDENGAVCNVVWCSGVTLDRSCMRLTFSDGESIVADEDHQWLTESRRDIDRMKGVGGKNSSTPRWSIKTTKEICQTLRRSQSRLDKVDWNHRVLISGACVLPEKALPIHPYVLGAWLGDGTSSAGAITIGHADRDEMVERLVDCGETVNKLKVNCLYSFSPTIKTKESMENGLRSRLRQLGVLNNKHIPAAYLRASIEQRMDLMRGLMDTDGYVSKAGQCLFYTTCRALRDGFMELAYSLGYKPKCCESRATLYGKDCGPKWGIQFWGTSDNPPVYLTRKAERLKPPPEKKRRSSFRHIVGCEPVDSVPVRCVEVDSPNHLFLVGKSFIPTHNSFGAAGSIMLSMFMDKEPGAKIYGAAAEAEQAALIFNTTSEMIKRKPALESRVDIHDGYHRIRFKSDFSVQYRAITSKAATKHGLNPHHVTLDELHALDKPDLYDVLKTAQGARSQPLFLSYTTSDFERVSICNEVDDLAKNVRDGVVQLSHFLPVLYELPKGADWEDEAMWAVANPNLGVSVSLEFLRNEFKKAKAQPSYENTFKRLFLNVRTEQDRRWLPMAGWDANDERFEESDLVGQPCYAALDLSSTTDITALMLMFPQEDERMKLVMRFWVPGDNAKRRERDKGIPFEAWERQRFCRLTHGNEVDYRKVREEINALSKRYSIKEIAFDPWSAKHLAQILQDEDGFKMVEFRQGRISMSEPCKKLEALVAASKIAHNGHPVLRWMASNCAVNEDSSGMIKIDKANSSDRVDGMVALAMCIGRWMECGTTRQMRSYLEEETELLVI